MKKHLLLLGVIWIIGSCCSKQENCNCKLVVMNFMFDCFSEKELADFKIIKYDSTSGALVSSESIDFIRPRSGGVQYNINIETDTKYDIEIANKPLGISRIFTDFRYSIYDDPEPCYDCKTKARYKTCSKLGNINFLINGNAIKPTHSQSEEPTIFQGFNKQNCSPGYIYK